MPMPAVRTALPLPAAVFMFLFISVRLVDASVLILTIPLAFLC